MKPSSIRIKVCGLTRAQDVQAACAAGANFVGFVQYDKSPRHVSLPVLAGLLAHVQKGVQPVLLFVQATKAQISASVALCQSMGLGLPVLQFHGDETAQECEQLCQVEGQRVPYWAVARIPQEAGFCADFDLLEYARAHSKASAILLDTRVGTYGGGGRAFQWEAFGSQFKEWSRPTTNVKPPLVLSGGLNAANVTKGIEIVRPWAVDVNSGVESDKGIKDARKIAAFVAAVRAAAAPSSVGQ